jgi:hypothetical protein
MRREEALTIDRVHLTVETEGPVSEDESALHTDGRHIGAMLAAFAFGRRLAMVGLATVAILVLLPAVIAAQASSSL